MPAPVLLIISGAPCTGKTILGRLLASNFRLPLIFKDGIKERLFDRLGSADVAWSKLLSLTTYDILFYFTESLLEAGCSLAVEANFKVSTDSAKFQALRERFSTRLIQVHCHASQEILLERFRRRMESRERHPGHLDHLTYGDILASLNRGDYEAIEVEGPRFEVDTTDFSTIDYPSLIAAVRVAVDPDFGEAMR